MSQRWVVGRCVDQDSDAMPLYALKVGSRSVGAMKELRMKCRVCMFGYFIFLTMHHFFKYIYFYFSHHTTRKLMTDTMSTWNTYRWHKSRKNHIIMITRSKRNYIDYLSDHNENYAAAEEGAPPAVSEEVLRARAESTAKRYKPTLWEKNEEEGEKAPAPQDEKTDDKTLQSWMRYAQVLEYIADKEIVSRAIALFHKKMKENEDFMQHARDTFPAKNKEVSARARSQLFCRHVQNMSHDLFHQAQDTSSELVTDTKEKCFEKTMKLFALESGLTRL